MKQHASQPSGYTLAIRLLILQVISLIAFAQIEIRSTMFRKLHGASLRNRFHNPKDCGRGQLSVDLPTHIQRVGVS